MSVPTDQDLVEAVKGLPDVVLKERIEQLEKAESSIGAFSAWLLLPILVAEKEARGI